MSHTKGPWAAGYMFYNINGPDGEGVAEVKLIYRNKAEAAANANLISAAPEMLTACEAALVYLKLEQHMSKDELVGFLDSTIKKARGENV